MANKRDIDAEIHEVHLVDSRRLMSVEVTSGFDTWSVKIVQEGVVGNPDLLDDMCKRATDTYTTLFSQEPS